MRGLSLVCLAVLAGTTAGCLNRDLKPLNPCTQSGNVENVRVTTVDKVDLLFMVDNSRSMEEEQLSLADQFPRLVNVLATGQRPTGDDFPPVRDLQIGIISSDMGTGGFRVNTCKEPMFGDDGILRTASNTPVTGCSANPYKFLRYRPADDDEDLNGAARFAQDVSCIATALGTGGCGFEQQLEATLKAITPSTSEITFNQGTRGHADGQNRLDTGEPFVRPDSLLALVLVTDEEDCSARDPELFNEDSTVYGGEPNLKCSSLGFLNDPRMPIHPISRYVDGFLATRQAPDLLVYAAIVGVPTNLTVPATEGNPEVTFQQILEADLMREERDPVMAGQLRPSCNTARGLAFPPRRLVEVAQELENRQSNGIVQSICQADFTPALDAIIQKIADVLGGTCLPRPLNPDENSFVPCEVLEELPAEGERTRCDQIPGRTLVETSPEGRQICAVTQVGPGTAEPGWFYDQVSDCADPMNCDVANRCGAEGQRITYVDGSEPVTGTDVRLECLQPVQSSAAGNFVDIDAPCSPGEQCMTNGPGVVGGPVTGRGEFLCCNSTITDGCLAPPNAALQCDGATNTFEVPCVSDANCPIGWRCDLERMEGLGPVCVNPTCG